MDRGFLKYDKKPRMKSEYWIEWQKEAMQAEYSDTQKKNQKRNSFFHSSIYCIK